MSTATAGLYEIPQDLLDFRDTIRQIATEKIAPRAAEIDRDAEYPWDIRKLLAEQDILGLPFEEAYGGTGTGTLMLQIGVEEIAKACATSALILMVQELGTLPIQLFGSEEQKQKWLPRCASGELSPAFALSEPEAGSDPASMRTSAVREGEEWVINGQKSWITNAGVADFYVVFATTDRANRRISAFIVESDREGFDPGPLEHKLGIKGSPTGSPSFTDVRVPAENLVGEEGGQGRGFYLTLGGFAIGRLQTGGRALGVAQAGLEKACAYVTQRSQFGKPIGEYQLTQHKIGLMATRIAAARQLTYDVARTTEPKARAPLGPAMAKLFASDVAVWATQEAQLLHGGWGYAEEDRISRYVADAQVLPIFEGVKATLELKVIARALTAGGN